jgi:hypothetical protein
MIVEQVLTDRKILASAPNPVKLSRRDVAAKLSSPYEWPIILL